MDELILTKQQAKAFNIAEDAIMFELFNIIIRHYDSDALNMDEPISERFFDKFRIELKNNLLAFTQRLLYAEHNKKKL